MLLAFALSASIRRIVMLAKVNQGVVAADTCEGGSNTQQTASVYDIGRAPYEKVHLQR